MKNELRAWRLTTISAEKVGESVKALVPDGG
jgi:hypothetical protein